MRKSDPEMENYTIIAFTKGFYCPGFPGSQEDVLTQTPTAGDEDHWRGGGNPWLARWLSGNF